MCSRLLRFPRVPVDAGYHWVVSLELNCYCPLYRITSSTCLHKSVVVKSSSRRTARLLLVPISFHRSLHPFPAVDSARPVEDSLLHPYMAMVAAGGSALPTIQRGLEPIEREEAPVGTPPPVPVQEAVDAPSPATRFLSLLHKELRSSSYVLPRDSEGFLVDPLRMIAVALRSTDPVASLLSPITQESVIQTHHSINPNNLESKPAELVYPAPLVSSAVARGSSIREEEPKLKYLCTVTREGWSPRPEVVVKREREEEQVPEEVPRKKQRIQKRKPLLRKSIRHANLGDPHPDEQISQVTLCPKQILRRPSRYIS